MLLKDYLKNNKISLRDFCDVIGCSQGTLIAIRDGKLPAIIKVLKKIEKHTFKNVTIHEMIEYALSQEEETDKSDF